MIVGCDKCVCFYDDEYRSTICPHKAFPANDGNNNFTVHEEAHLSKPGDQYDRDYFLYGKQSGKSLYENYRWLPELTIPMAAHIVCHCDIKKTDEVLDFGCARGYTVKALRKLGYTAFGYDISEWAVENADPDVREHLNVPSMFARNFTWIIAKDVLEHVPDDDIAATVAMLMSCASRGVFVVVPLSADGKRYVVPEYEEDVTHVQRRSLAWWCGMFCKSGWSVEGRYRIKGIKDNYAQFPTGNGFVTARRIDG